MGSSAGPVPPERAGIVRRLAATLYESLILGTLALALGFLLLPVLGLTGIPPASGQLAALSPLASAGSFVAFFALYGAYFVWLWSEGRRTLPMQTWHLALRSEDGGLAHPVRVLRRYLAWWIGPACAIGAYLALRPFGHGGWALAALSINYAWALFDPDRQFLHDRIAATRVVRL